MGVSRPESVKRDCAFPSLIPERARFVKKTIVFIGVVAMPQARRRGAESAGTLQLRPAKKLGATALRAAVQPKTGCGVELVLREAGATDGARSVLSLSWAASRAAAVGAQPDTDVQDTDRVGRNRRAEIGGLVTIRRKGPFFRGGWPESARTLVGTEGWRQSLKLARLGSPSREAGVVVCWRSAGRRRLSTSRGTAVLAGDDDDRLWRWAERSGSGFRAASSTCRRSSKLRSWLGTRGYLDNFKRQAAPWPAVAGEAGWRRAAATSENFEATAEAGDGRFAGKAEGAELQGRPGLGGTRSRHVRRSSRLAEPVFRAEP